MDLRQPGVKLLGQVPQGLPPFGFQQFMYPTSTTCCPLALAVFFSAWWKRRLLAACSRSSTLSLRPNQELLGIASANVMPDWGTAFR